MGERLRILICAPEAPMAPLNGLRLVVANVSRELARRHDVILVAPAQARPQEAAPQRRDMPSREPPSSDRSPDRAAIQGVTLHAVPPPTDTVLARTGRRIASVVRRIPVEALVNRAPMMRAVTALRAAHRFDAALVFGGGLAGIAHALAGIPAVVAPLDAWDLNEAAAAAAAHGPRRWWRHAQRMLVRRYTARAYRPFHAVVLVTAEDARHAAALDPTLATAVIPVGVDTHHFSPGQSASRDEATVLFTGTLDYAPNVAAATFLATDVLPRLRQSVPRARLRIAGRRPGTAVTRLAQPPVVEVLGDVDDLRQVLRPATVFACAMTTGTGLKNKLLEAMACGAPAVSTTLGMRGLDVSDGRELLVADDAEAFAAALARVLTTPVLARELSGRARRYAVQRHAWTSVGERYEALLAEASRSAHPSIELDEGPGGARGRVI